MNATGAQKHSHSVCSPSSFWHQTPMGHVFFAQLCKISGMKDRLVPWFRSRENFKLHFNVVWKLWCCGKAEPVYQGSKRRSCPSKGALQVLLPAWRTGGEAGKGEGTGGQRGRQGVGGRRGVRDNGRQRNWGEERKQTLKKVVRQGPGIKENLPPVVCIWTNCVACWQRPFKVDSWNDMDACDFVKSSVLQIDFTSW